MCPYSKLPNMVENNLHNFRNQRQEIVGKTKEHQRADASRVIRDLYQLRIHADYYAAASISELDARYALGLMRKIYLFVPVSRL